MASVACTAAATNTGTGEAQASSNRNRQGSTKIRSRAQARHFLLIACSVQNAITSAPAAVRFPAHRPGCAG
jgi:hypothetical protein